MLVVKNLTKSMIHFSHAFSGLDLSFAWAAGTSSDIYIFILISWQLIMSNKLLLANLRDGTKEIHNQFSEDLKLVAHQIMSSVGQYFSMNYSRV